MSAPAASVDTEEEEDAMIEKASIPNLASLFAAGKKKGLLKPTTIYGECA